MTDSPIALPAPSASREPASIVDAVRSIVADVLNIQETIALDQPLVALGAQSYDFVQVTFRIENAFGVTLPASYVNPGPHSISTYAEAMRRALDGAGA